MKTIAIVAFVLGFIAYEITAEQESSQSITAKCAGKTGASAADVAAIQKGDFSKPNEKIECYAKCVLDHTEMLEEGMLRESLLLKNFSAKYTKADMDKALNACKTITGQDHCQVAYNLVKCFSDNKVKLI